RRRTASGSRSARSSWTRPCVPPRSSDTSAGTVAVPADPGTSGAPPVQLLFFGILTGSILAVASVGFAMIRQIEGFLNIAHGQFLLLGALFGLYFVEALDLPIAVGGLLGAALVGLLGVVVGWLVFAPLRGKSLLAQFFTSIGVAFVLYGLINATWTGP